MTAAPPFGVEIVQLKGIDFPAIIEWMETQQWQASGVVRDDVRPDQRSSQTLWIPMHSYRNPSMIYEMNRAVYDAIDAYAYRWDFGFSSIETVSVQKYNKGDFYHAHADNGPFNPRIVSAVLYLNTVSGGETRFTHFDYSVKPKQGRLAIFPSNYIYQHEALPPKRGTKYAAAYWATP